MLNLLNAIKELSLEIYSNDLEDSLSTETRTVMELVENYLASDPAQNLIVCLTDQDTYDIEGYIIFSDEDETERIVEGEPLTEVIEDDRWIALGDSIY